MRHLRSLVTTVAVAMTANAANAQNTVSLDAIDLYATIASVSVIVDFTGDDDSDATGRVEYRESGVGAFRVGHHVVRLPAQRFAVSVMFLDPATRYDVQVVVDDPDNGAPTTIAGTLTTRADAPPPTTGRDYYVDAVNGNDFNPGTAGLPFQTVQTGADAAQPGDTVHVLPGLYHERVAPPRGGTAGNPITFIADNPGAIIDGSDQSLTSGATWTDEGNGIYSTPFAGTSLYAAVDDERIYDYQTLLDLQEENGNIGTPGVFPGGFFVDEPAGLLYLATPWHDDPGGHQIHVAILGSAFFLDNLTDVVIEGFELRYFDGPTVDVRDTARSWVRGNTTHHADQMVRVRRALASENVVENNTFRDTSVYTWPWSSVKNHTPAGSAIAFNHGYGNIARWNDIDGAFNGVFSGAFGDANEDIARDVDAYGNTMRQIGDDGLELEGAQVNVRYWENFIEDSYHPISIAPIEVGPVFLVRNVICGYTQHAVKVNNGTYGWVFIYHTTAMPQPGLRSAAALQPPVPFGAITTRNNIWEANHYVVEMIPTSLVSPIDWDYDNFYTNDTDMVGRFAKWFNVRYSDLPAFIAGTGLETNGFQLQPTYESALTCDLRLTAGHGLLDAGEIIPGINDTDVIGPGIDVGAYERDDGAAVLSVLRSDAVTELPLNPDDRFDDILLPWLDPDPVLTDPIHPALLFYRTEPARMLFAVRAGGSVELIERP